MDSLITTSLSISGKRWDYGYYSSQNLRESLKEISQMAIMPLRMLASIVNQRICPAKDCPDREINYIGLSNIESGTGRLSSFSPIIGREILSSSPTFTKGDILYGRMRPYFNKVWLAEFDGVCSGEVLVLRSITTKIDVNFLHALLLSNITLEQVIPLQSGSSLPRISTSELLEIQLPLPPRPIQDRIAQVMQDAYAARRAKLAEAEQISSQISDYILQQLNVNLAAIERKRTTLTSISAIAGKRFDFEAVVTMGELKLSLAHATTLRDVVSQVNERILPVESCPEDDIHYIGLADVESHTGELTNFTPTRGSEILSSSPVFQKGDILFGRMRPYLNKVWLATFNGVCSGEAIVLRPDLQKVDPGFLHALLLSRITLDQVVPLQSGTSLPRVSASDVLNIKLPIPDNLQQQKVIGEEITRRRAAARRLRAEAEAVVAEAKARVERMILGEEAVPA